MSLIAGDGNTSFNYSSHLLRVSVLIAVEYSEEKVTSRVFIDQVLKKEFSAIGFLQTNLLNVKALGLLSESAPRQNALQAAFSLVLSIIWAMPRNSQSL